MLLPIGSPPTHQPGTTPNEQTTGPPQSTQGEADERTTTTAKDQHGPLR
jgi:hypothetical protein